MNAKISVAAILLMSSMVTATSWAAVDTAASAGGDVVVCPGAGLVTLDFYHATLPTFGPKHPPIPDIKNWDENQMIEFFRNRLKNTTLLSQLDQALTAIGSVNEWIIADFKDKDTSNDPYELPDGCRRVKGSARYSNATFIDPSYTALMPRAQLGILRMHEALYSIGDAYHSDRFANPFNYTYDKRAGQISTDARELIRKLLILDTPDSELVEGIKVFTKYAYSYEEKFHKLNNGIFGSRVRTVVSEAKKRCGLWADSSIGNRIYLRYYDYSYYSSPIDLTNYCRSNDELEFTCPADGSPCSLTSGAIPDGFSLGCELVIDEVKGNLAVSCPNTSETWIYGGPY
jgi:hypothetical protein